MIVPVLPIPEVRPPAVVALLPRPEPPAPPAPPRPDGPVTVSESSVPGWSHEHDMGVVRTSTADLPPLRSIAPMLAAAVAEALAGQRPVEQLRRFCAPDVFAGLQPRCRTGAGGPVVRVMRVRACEPADGIAEIAAVIRQGRRALAAAMRLQGIDGRWRITVLQVD